MFGAYANLNDLVDYSKDKELFDRIEAIVESSDGLKPEVMLPLHYAYAKALDDNGKHEKALEHFIAGGKLKRAQLKYDEAETVKFFEDIKKAFPAKIFKDRPYEGNQTDKLLFIVGMPRSGSTLVEQIISSHESVYGAGEVKYFSQALHKLRDRFPSLSRFPEMVGELKPNHYKLVADGYEQAILKSAGDAKIVTDKLLTNYFFVGLLHLLFPERKDHQHPARSRRHMPFGVHQAVQGRHAAQLRHGRAWPLLPAVRCAHEALGKGLAEGCAEGRRI